MAHLISVYKLNKAENQDDISKMFQIFKLEIYQLHKIGAKIYATKTSPRSFFLGGPLFWGDIMVGVQLQ